MKNFSVFHLFLLFSGAVFAVEKMNYGNTQTFRIEEGVEKIDSKYWTVNKKDGLEYYSSPLTLGFGHETNNEVRSIIEKDKSGLVQAITTQQSIIRFDIYASPGSKEEIRIIDQITRVDLPSHASTTCDENGCLVVTPNLCHSIGKWMQENRIGKIKKGTPGKNKSNANSFLDKNEQKKIFDSISDLRKAQIQHIEHLKKNGILSATKYQTKDLMSEKTQPHMRLGHKVLKACEEIPATLVRAQN